MTRILIADDHPIVRRGLRDLLEQEPGLTVGGEATTAGETIAMVRGAAWDLVILDLSLPDRHGLEVLAELRHGWPSLPVLVLTFHAEEHFAVRALKTGAAGYLTKESAPAELVGAVRTILRGGRFVSAALAEILAERLRDEAGTLPHERLSDREHEVLLLMGAGKTPTLIADQLHLSVKTVSTYRARILEKLGLETTAEVIHYVARHHLLE